MPVVAVGRAAAAGGYRAGTAVVDAALILCFDGFVGQIGAVPNIDKVKIDVAVVRPAVVGAQHVDDHRVWSVG